MPAVGSNAGGAAALATRLYTLSNSVRLAIGIGDLTVWTGDAIVNAANERMLGGGGVDGAIHRAAGKELYEACKKVPEVRRGIRCPTGEARITKGFKLPADNVIHTVGPIYQNDEVSRPLLAAAHRSCLDLASEEGLSSIAFPALSCGVFGYPIQKAAHVAVQECIDFSDRAANSSLKSIDFVLFSPEIYKAWIHAAEELIPSSSSTCSSSSAADGVAAASQDKEGGHEKKDKTKANKGKKNDEDGEEEEEEEDVASKEDEK